jgi:RimJ/RimL family protein N-acetyltransferase
MPSIPELTGRLTGPTVELRSIAEWDIPEILIAHQDDPGMYKQLGLEKPPTGAKLGREVEDAPFEREAGRSVSFTIVEPGSADCRGRVDVHTIDWDASTAQLCVWVVPQRRGLGYSTAAVALASEWLRGETGIETVIAGD